MSSTVRTILASELHQLAGDLALQAPGLREGSEEAASQCLGLCERLGQVAGMIEAPALQEVAVFLMSNIPALMGSDTHVQGPAELCADLELCLLEGMDSERWSVLAGNLCDARWPSCMEATAAEEVTEALRPLASPEDEPQEAPPDVTAADLTLRAPDEVGQETLQAFFQEAPFQAARLSALFAEFDLTLDESQVGAAQRLTHTLKGSSALCGLHAIAHLAHGMEAALQRLLTTAGNCAPSHPAQLIEAADMLEQLIELSAERGEAPPSLLPLIHALHTAPIGSSEEVALDAPAREEPGTARLADESPAAGSITEPITESRADPAPETGTIIVVPTLNVPTTLIDENLRRAGEINLAIGQLNAQVDGTLQRANRLMQQLERVQHQVYELETLVDTRGIPSRRLQTKLGGAGVSENFDPLELDEYTALHSLSRAFAESTLDSRELSRELGDELLKLQNLMAQHARLGRELTGSVMNARLVPVATIVPRLERIVRQVARQTGREVELRIQGRELSIDTDILNGLVEPLMHALRNAVDHGVEPPQERVACGKSPTGHITLVFQREGNRIEVTCRDDGRGLDYEAIARRAIAQRLLNVEAKPSERELAALIFAPGFSTRDSVTSISGRGVGMDVVRASIERLKGSVHIESAQGAGCTLSFRLPLSLTTAHALFVGVGSSTYGLPSTAVEQVLYSDAGRVLQLGDDHAFEYGGRVFPLYSLGELLGYEGASLMDLARSPSPIVIANADSGQIALSIDKALDSRQVVIKGLSAMLPAIPGVAGASVMPNGDIGIILEVRELLRQFTGSSLTSIDAAPAAAPGATGPRALIVDDSLSARRAMAQLLGDCGYDVDTAIDGLDAITKMEQRRPDILLVDLEMPRMNGLELTSHLRARLEFAALPIVMITSRGADKHRTQALRAGVTEFLTKPYLEHDLIERLEALSSMEPPVRALAP